MTDTEITALAREYAEETVSHTRLSTTIADDTEDVIRFMLRRYCLVEKDTVREALWKLTDKFLEDNDHKAFGAASAAIESLFPDLGKEVEG